MNKLAIAATVAAIGFSQACDCNTYLEKYGPTAVKICLDACIAEPVTLNQKPTEQIVSLDSL